jgi:hypothetical protein
MQAEQVKRGSAALPSKGPHRREIAAVRHGVIFALHEHAKCGPQGRRLTRRATLVDLSRRFDITWFMGAINKYRHFFYEMLVDSFFLQLFALVSPLFFQVVIDKVLVHRSLEKLDVLVIGLRGDLAV